MKKTIYIHIGSPKTATSTLQVFFNENERTFNQEDICFPISGKGGAFSKRPLSHHRIAWSITNDDYLPTGLKTEDGYIIAGELAEEIQNFEFSTHIISSEAFFSPYINTAPLLDALEAYDVYIVVYLRRQDDWVESNYGTNIMMPYPSVDSIEEFIKHSQKTLLYSNIINLWAKSLGNERIIVRPFDRNQLTNGDIIDDFISILPEIRIETFKKPDRNYNVRLSRESLRFLLNLKKEMTDKEMYSKIVRLLVRAESNQVLFDNKMSFLSPQEKTALLERFTSDNNDIARTYLNKDELFSTNALEDPGWIPLPEESVKENIQIFVAAFNEGLAKGSKTLSSEIFIE